MVSHYVAGDISSQYHRVLCLIWVSCCLFVPDHIPSVTVPFYRFNLQTYQSLFLSFVHWRNTSETGGGMFLN